MKKLFLLPLLFLSFAQAGPILCKIIEVIDGETVTCFIHKDKQIKVKLYQIAAPKLDQPYGQEAKQVLSDMLLSKNIELLSHGRDKYDYLLATIISDPPCDLNKSCAPVYFNDILVKRGYAWHYPFDKKNLEYIQAEKEAREAKRGLWADKNPIAPWEWRKKK